LGDTNGEEKTTSRRPTRGRVGSEEGGLSKGFCGSPHKRWNMLNKVL